MTNNLNENAKKELIRPQLPSAGMESILLIFGG
jgi:hypothetical protein